LATAGAEVVIADREHERAAQTLGELGGISLEYLDILDPRSIDDFAERFLATQRPLHIQINSAASWRAP
jgi:NAD(P)-dependent dehydrogenase (short-subunit alcohol dehydrogenase family)